MIQFKHFETVTGESIQIIDGQNRIGYSLSSFIDFYDMEELYKNKTYEGSTISFYDFENGKIYKPFPKQKNIIYAMPVYLKNSF